MGVLKCPMGTLVQITTGPSPRFHRMIVLSTPFSPLPATPDATPMQHRLSKNDNNSQINNYTQKQTEPCNIPSLDGSHRTIRLHCNSQHPSTKRLNYLLSNFEPNDNLGKQFNLPYINYLQTITGEMYQQPIQSTFASSRKMSTPCPLLDTISSGVGLFM